MFSLTFVMLHALLFSPIHALIDPGAPIMAAEHATVPAQAIMDAGIASGIGTSPSDPTAPDFYAKVFAEIAAHNWRYVAALSVIFFTFLLRTYASNLIPALKKGKWIWTVAVLGSALAALSTHLLSNAPVGGVSGILSVLMYGAFVGLSAAGIVKGAKEFTSDK